jgi:hypothetical protein
LVVSRKLAPHFRFERRTRPAITRNMNALRIPV